MLGDPREALVWLVNELSRLNLPLLAGQVVTTGTCLVPLAAEPGNHVVADFDIGKSLTFVPTRRLDGLQLRRS